MPPDIYFNAYDIPLTTGKGIGMPMQSPDPTASLNTFQQYDCYNEILDVVSELGKIKKNFFLNFSVCFLVCCSLSINFIPLVYLFIVLTHRIGNNH